MIFVLTASMFVCTTSAAALALFVAASTAEAESISPEMNIVAFEPGSPGNDSVDCKISDALPRLVDVLETLRQTFVFKIVATKRSDGTVGVASWNSIRPVAAADSEVTGNVPSQLLDQLHAKMGQLATLCKQLLPDDVAGAEPRRIFDLILNLLNGPNIITILQLRDSGGAVARLQIHFGSPTASVSSGGTQRSTPLLVAGRDWLFWGGSTAEQESGVGTVLHLDESSVELLRRIDTSTSNISDRLGVLESDVARLLDETGRISKSSNRKQSNAEQQPPLGWEKILWWTIPLVAGSVMALLGGVAGYRHGRAPPDRRAAKLAADLTAARADIAKILTSLQSRPVQHAFGTSTGEVTKLRRDMAALTDKLSRVIEQSRKRQEGTDRSVGGAGGALHVPLPSTQPSTHEVRAERNLSPSQLYSTSEAELLDEYREKLKTDRLASFIETRHGLWARSIVSNNWPRSLQILNEQPPPAELDGFIFIPDGSGLTGFVLPGPNYVHGHSAYAESQLLHTAFMGIFDPTVGGSFNVCRAARGRRQGGIIEIVERGSVEV